MKIFDNLLEKDHHIVEKRKIIFLIPLAIVIVAAIMMIVFNFTLGSPLNLGTDFTGGYSIDVKLGNKLTDDNYDEYCRRIENVMSFVEDENGKSYSIRVDNMQKQGSGDSSAIHVKYPAVKGATETEMIDVINPAIQRALENDILMLIPSVDIEANTVKLTYNTVLVEPAVNEQRDAFVAALAALNDEHSAGITLDGDAETAITLSESDNKTLIIKCSAVNDTAEVKTAIANAMRIADIYAGSVSQGDLVGATVSTELLFNAVLAVSLALVFMLCYIGLRFQLSSGLACIIALFHDIIVMLCAMAIFRIEINNTFIAALITILGYSINNSIIIFDRVRENRNSVFAKNMTPEEIANKSIRETILRSINTTITTLIMMLMVAIIGVPDIRVFAFPIIIGLLAGTFSSVCIAPSLWALFQRVGKNKNKSNFNVKKKEVKAKTDNDAQALA